MVHTRSYRYGTYKVIQLWYIQDHTVMVHTSYTVIQLWYIQGTVMVHTRCRLIKTFADVDLPHFLVGIIPVNSME